MVLLYNIMAAEISLGGVVIGVLVNSTAKAWFTLVVRIRIIVIFYHLRPSQLFTDKCEHTKWDIPYSATIS